MKLLALMAGASAPIMLLGYGIYRIGSFGISLLEKKVIAVPAENMVPLAEQQVVAATRAKRKIDRLQGQVVEQAQQIDHLQDVRAEGEGENERLAHRNFELNDTVEAQVKALRFTKKKHMIYTVNSTRRNIKTNVY